MKIAIVAISEKGKKIALKIKMGGMPESKLYIHQSSLTTRRKRKLTDLVGKIFNKFDGIIFCMPLGIVIRIIAPHIKNKYIDPAVVVVDDAGRFVISALSGHEGGANNLAIQVANILSAEPVITTASETQKKLVLGIGCRAGIKKAEIIKAVRYALSRTRSSIKKLRCITTIDLKQNEKGLREACLELGVPLRIVSTDLIKNFTGKYHRSNFVKEKLGISGVEGVCEPCALITAKKPKLILPKEKLGRVTVAVAQEN